MSSKHHITCVFEDGATSQFTSSSFETVYQAALRSGLTLETDCREGACGVCKAYLSDGDCDLGDFSDEALTEDEEEQGYVLSCQTRARSDLEPARAHWRQWRPPRPARGPAACPTPRGPSPGPT